MKNRLILTGVALTILSSGGVQAQTILNGSFEQQSASKPTDGGLYQWNHTGNVVVDQTYSGNGGNLSLSTAITPYAGNYFAVMTPNGDGNATLSQIVTSATGSDLDVSFALDLAVYNNGKGTGLSSADAFEVVDVTTSTTLASVALNSLLSNPGAGVTTSGWLAESADVTGISSGDQLEFEFLLDSQDLVDYSAALAVDDVSLAPPVPGPTVPDGGFTLALLGLSAGLLGAGRRLLVRRG